MTVELKMPKFGSMMKTGYVGDWLVEVGDTVKKGDPLLEIETDKLANKVVSTTDGVIKELVAETGDEIPVGGVLAIIEA